MGEEERDLTKRPELSPRDIAHAFFTGIIQIGASYIITGPVAASLLSLVLEDPLSRRRDEWIESIAIDLVKLREQVEGFSLENLSENETFVTTVLQTIQIALRTHQQEKLEALRNAVLNSALPNAPEDTLQMVFLSFIDRFTTHHLQQLALIRDPNGWLADYGIEHTTIYPGGPANVMNTVFPDLPEGLPKLVASDLRTAGLYTFPAGNDDDGSISIGLKDYHITDIGRQFLEFIESPID